MSEIHGGSAPVWLAVHDKVVHLGLYAVMGVALAWGQRKSPFPVHHAVILLAGVGYGAVDEWHQSFVPNRFPAVDDFLADVAGVLAGYVLFLGAWWLWRRRRESAGDAEPEA